MAGARLKATDWRGLCLSAAGGNLIAISFTGDVRVLFIGGILLVLAGIFNGIHKETAN